MKGGKEGHTISQLPNPNKPRHILIKHLKATTILLRFARVAETTWAVEDFLEGFEIDCCFSKHISQSFSSPFHRDRSRILQHQPYNPIANPYILSAHLFLMGYNISSSWKVGGAVGKSGGRAEKNVQSPPTPASNSRISASVGFCPQARSRSPRDCSATRPLPRLSKRAKASL